MKNRILGLALCLLAPFVKGQPSEHIAVHDAAHFVTAFMDQWNIPGGSVAIAKHGRLIYSRGFGFADRSRSIPCGPDNLFRIASVSKPVTSIAIMKLQEEGKLSLTDTVFGEGRLLDDPYYLSVIRDQRIYDITVQQLLEHTAGWDRNKKTDGYSHSDPAFFPLHVTNTEDEPNPVGDSTLVRFSLRKGLHHEPGKKFSYSNVGYLVLGKIIEKVSGMSYETYVTTHVLEPLAIYDMKLGRNLEENRQEQEVEYVSNWTTRSVYGDGKIVPGQYGGFNLEAMNAHGGWIATATDLTRLLHGIDGVNNPADVISPASIAEMTTASSANANYAKGWQVNSKNNLWHTGSLDGTASFVGRTADGYTWAFLFNARADNSAQFWRELDKLPWNCIEALDNSGNLDLPLEFGTLEPAQVRISIAGDGYGSPAKDAGYAKEAQLSMPLIMSSYRRRTTSKAAQTS
jgi:CubicO group peptidase (beta-lactamase class C family)